ncbi:MAG TPA: hypothetical protein DCX89_06570 [Saprospirales bacterium]|nr:hypothetical protein [Saprospirales bacterium]HAY71536.1 hypothetical protein [Saprospirales bacterium]
MEVLSYLLLFSVPFLTGLVTFGLRKEQVFKYLDYIKLFGGAFFLGVIVLHLVPEIYHASLPYTGIFIAAGFFTQLIIESFTGSDPHDAKFPGQVITYSYALLIGLSVHAFIEGFPLASAFSDSAQHIHDHSHMDHHHHHDHFGEAYLIGVLIHRIPMVIVMVLIMLGSRLSRTNIITQLLIFSSMAPLGMLTAGFVAPDSAWSHYIMAFVVGSLTHVAMHLIDHKSINTSNIQGSILKIVIMLLGFILVYLVI